MRCAFKVFYIGEDYNGFQRQPHGRTIEGMLEKAFQESGYIRSFKESNYRGSSRTDAKVNALENIFLLDVQEEPNLFYINKHLPRDGSILVWAKANVPDDFKLKPAKYKTYSYAIRETRPEILDGLERLYQFEGEHDFRPFIRKDKVPRPTICKIYSIYYEVIDDRVSIEITGDHFGWEMIRRMIGFLLDLRYLDISPTHVLTKKARDLPIHPAPGRYLTLQKVGLPEEPQWSVVDLKKVVRSISLRRREHISILEDQLNLLSLLSKRFSGSEHSRQGASIVKRPYEKT